MSKTSWTAKRGRSYSNAPVRERAAKYADLNVGTHGAEKDWQRLFNGFLAGWCAANRIQYAKLRVELAKKL